MAIALGEEGTGTGSCRSIPGVDIGAAVRAAVDAGLLAKGGGHAMAAGLTIDPRQIADLGRFLDERARGGFTAAKGDVSLPVDGAVTAGGATVSLVETIEKAGPFGAGQPDPVFVLPAHRVSYAETVGTAHVRLTLAGSDGSTLKAMAFRAAGRPLGDFLLSARGGRCTWRASSGSITGRGRRGCNCASSTRRNPAEASRDRRRTAVTPPVDLADLAGTRSGGIS